MKQPPIRREYFGEPKSFEEIQAEEHFRQLPKIGEFTLLEVPVRRNDLEYLMTPRRVNHEQKRRNTDGIPE